MAENGGGASLPAASSSLSSRPTLTLPPRSSMESLFAGNFGVSPGPMTLVSSFFADDPDSECRSFSQLLAGAMASPAASQRPPHLPPPTSTEGGSREKQLGGGDELMFKQNRPSGLEISQWPVFTVPPGLSPGSFLDSPGLFPGSQSPFGMSHQQALAQVTAQAQYVRMQAEHANSSSGAAAAASTSQVQYSTSNKTSHQQMLPLTSNSTTAMLKESSEIYHSDQRVQPMPHTVDKPTDDGYNWRKYGQKQVKGSEYPRSYYKCSHLGCPVKKKVEHSIDGQVTEIIYRGLHDHPLPNKRTKDNGNQSGNLNCQANLGLSSKVQTANLKKLKDEVAASSVSKIDCDSNVASSEHLSGSSGSEEVADNKTIVEVKDEDEPDSKRRNLECRIAEPSSTHKTVAEPKIIVQTTSEVDLLDDGYRWRKYGQKVVKGNPYPRSYYKCTYTGCSVRKHVERAATDPRAVITAYEGKHNHDVPLGKSNVRNTANSNVSQLKAQSMEDKKHAPMDNSRDTGNYDQQPVALLQLKEHPT